MGKCQDALPRGLNPGGRGGPRKILALVDWPAVGEGSSRTEKGTPRGALFSKIRQVFRLRFWIEES